MNERSTARRTTARRRRGGAGRPRIGLALAGGGPLGAIYEIGALAAPWLETEAGHVELLIGLDHRQWLPVHVED